MTQPTPLRPSARVFWAVASVASFGYLVAMFAQALA